MAKRADLTVAASAFASIPSLQATLADKKTTATVFVPSNTVSFFSRVKGPQHVTCFFLFLIFNPPHVAAQAAAP